MIKRVLRAYNSRCHLVLLVLANRKVPRLPLSQIVEYLINLVAEVLVVLPHLHGVDHFDEGGEVLLLHRRFVVDIPDERRVEQRFRLAPEVVAGFPVPLATSPECSP